MKDLAQNAIDEGWDDIDDEWRDIDEGWDDADLPASPVARTASLQSPASVAKRSARRPKREPRPDAAEVAAKEARKSTKKALRKAAQQAARDARRASGQKQRRDEPSTPAVTPREHATVDRESAAVAARPESSPLVRAPVRSWSPAVVIGITVAALVLLGWFFWTHH